MSRNSVTVLGSGILVNIDYRAEKIVRRQGFIPSSADALPVKAHKIKALGLNTKQARSSFKRDNRGLAHLVTPKDEKRINMTSDDQSGSVISTSQLVSLMTLAEDKSDSGRLRLTEELGKIATFNLNRNDHPDQCDLMNGIFESLVKTTELEIRKRIALELCSLDWISKDLVFKLATDEIAVAQPVLEHSLLLDNQDLVRVVRQKAIDHRLTISARPDVGEAVSDALASFNEPPVLVSLLQNQKAKLSAKTIEFLTEASRHRNEYRGPLLRREDIPADVFAKLASRIADFVRSDIAQKHNVPIDALADIARHAAEDLLVTPVGLDTTALERATLQFAAELEAVEGGPAIPFWQGHAGVFEGRLMTRTGLDRNSVHILIHELAPFGIALLARYVEMTPEDFANACRALYSNRLIAGKTRDLSLRPFEGAYQAIKKEAATRFIERLREDPGLLRDLDVSALVRLR